MTQRDETTDRADAAVLAALDGAVDLDALELERELLELLGLLGTAAAPVEPSNTLGERIAAAIRSEPVLAGQRPNVVELSPRTAASPRSVSWARAIAAVLAVCVVGLGVLSASLSRELAEQREVADRQRATIDRLEGADSAGELASLRENLRQVESTLQIVTGAQTEVCALAPPDGEASPMPSARGTLFVAADHQHWFLKARGLRPLPEGTYQVWFQPEDGRPVNAGSFDVVGDHVELGSDRMPAKTRAIFVTVEPGPSDEPSGPVVLYGDEAMLLL